MRFTAYITVGSASSFIPFLTYADNRELRKEIHQASTTKAGKGNEFDNQGIIIFFSATLGMMFAVDILKIYFASKLQKYIKPKVLQIIGLSIGLIMMGVGLYILFVGFEIPQEEFLDNSIEIIEPVPQQIISPG